jgi:hypothetical protein
MRPQYREHGEVRAPDGVARKTTYSTGSMMAKPVEIGTGDI